MNEISIHVPAEFNFLAPWRCEVLRIGGPNDGGYVVGAKSLARTRSLLSLGISSEWSFDSDFLSRRPDISYVGCDRASGSLVHLAGALRAMRRSLAISEAFGILGRAVDFAKLVPPLSLSRRRRFVRKWVRAVPTAGSTEVAFADLAQSLRSDWPMFLKMDIEGGEYELFPLIVALLASEPESISGMCIEFHEVGTRIEEIRGILGNLEPMFSVVHLHANNFVPLINGFPDAVEITLAPRGDTERTRLTNLPRLEVDSPNSSQLPDFRLFFDC